MRQSIEIHEKVLLDTYSQYNQIFTTPSDRLKESSFNKIDKFDLDFNDSSLLFSWISLRLNNLINELRLSLSHLIKENQQFFKQLLALKQQGDRFSCSLSRIGLNFAHQFDQLFNEYLEHDLKLNLSRMVKRFGSSLDSYNIVSSPACLNVSNGVSSGAKEGGDASQTARVLSPPSSLLQFIPLKNLCNDLIRLFDKLASFPATSALVFKFKLLLEEHLRQTSQLIEKYIRSETSSLKANEMELLATFKSIYKESLIVHAQECYRALLGSFAAVDLLGMSRIEFSKIQNDGGHSSPVNFNELDRNKIYQSL